MRRNGVVPFTLYRLGDFLPFLAGMTVFAAMAIQSALSPVRPALVEFPPAAGDVPAEALPQASVAPDEWRESTNAPALPREAVPDNTSVSSPQPNVAMAAPPIAGTLQSEERAMPLPTEQLGLGSRAAPAAGNLHIRTNRANAVSSRAANLMEQIRRLHPAPQRKLVNGRREAKTQRQTLTASTPARPSRRTAAPLPAGLGGPSPISGMLGGPYAAAPGYLGAIDGASMHRRF